MVSALRRSDLHGSWQFGAAAWARPGASLAYSKLELLPAEVPGHVHLDLARAGIIGHPFVQLGELGCQWVDEQEFLYVLDFDWQPTLTLPRRILRFEGLDSLCRISVNGQELARHDNMFLPLELDVSQELVPGRNELCVVFSSSVLAGHQRRASYFAKEGLSPDLERFDERSFVRKAQYMYGWDWGPRLVSCGIWRPVSLLEFAARLTDVHVTQEHLPDGSVRVAAQASVEGRGTVVHCLEGFPPKPGDGEVAHLARPRLWHPACHGEPSLYRLTTYLCSESLNPDSLPTAPREARLALEAAALDVRVTRIGLRRLELVAEPDESGKTFAFRVNGEELWAFGANYIPSSSFPSQGSEAELRKLLTMARKAGMNMLRVWGGGVYESDTFYDLCDELGLLVWQDFPFACAYYPDDDPACALLREEASPNILRLRNHPSLALWCGNNENLEMFEKRWGDPRRHPERYYGRRLYDEVLPRLLAELDPGRPYIPSSPHGGEKASGDDAGDDHYWDAWHGRGDWVHYRDSKARFASEFGFASSCSERAWARAFGRPEGVARAFPASTSLRDPVVRWHDKTGKGLETFVGFVELHYPRRESLEDWIYYSQLNQRDALRYAIEHYRRSGRCKGTLIWQLNDCWPVQSWAVIDSEMQPKPAWFELERLYAPVLLSLQWEGSRLSAWAVADHLSAPQTESLELALRDVKSGAVLERFSAEVVLVSGMPALALTLDLARYDATEVFVTGALGGARSERLLCEPKELRPAVVEELEYRLEARALLLSAPAPLFDLWLEDAEGAKRFAANCLTVGEPGPLRIPYAGSGDGLRARSLSGAHRLKPA